jgi:photosystem II stability/assembly factor-like uncharacterized protein
MRRATTSAILLALALALAGVACGGGSAATTGPSGVTDGVTRPAPVVAEPPPARPAAEVLAETGATWQPLATIAFPGKQDDIAFVDAERGWYVNGGGFIYATTDGGATWTEQLHQPGTFFRAVGFVDAERGFAANVGTDYFPNVSDTTPLYQTADGGATWKAVEAIEGPAVKGICAVDVLESKFIDHGVLADRVTIRAAGRVGGPAMMATSRDGGATWTSEDLSAQAGMILDVKFLDERTGFLCASSDANVEVSHARILKTTDGGTSWRVVYESKRPYELTWKCSFPTEKVGYASIQSYDPAPAASQRYVAKTVDGGETWTELPLVDDPKVREFGIGFADPDTGWVGVVDGGYQTTDGGKTWTHVPMGRAVNKIRVVPAPERGGFVGYAIGVDVFKLDARAK